MSGEAADEDTLADLAFAWRACRSVRSNAITLLAVAGASVGVGMGSVQPRRLVPASGGTRGGPRQRLGGGLGCVLPVRREPGPQILLDAGVKAIVQPGGSLRDAQTVEAASRRSHYVFHRYQALLPLSPAKGQTMTAQRMDGKQVAAQVKEELAVRVAALRERGVVPGLGTVLVGDDPGSQLYVAGKHRDCAQVEIESIRVEARRGQRPRPRSPKPSST